MVFCFLERNRSDFFGQVHNLKEPYGKCEDTIDLEFFDSYSLSSCYINCKQKYLLEQCGCREFYMPAGLFMEGVFSLDNKLLFAFPTARVYSVLLQAICMFCANISL